MLMWRLAKAVLILLLAIGIPFAQTTTLAAAHSFDHSSHCCGICHTGHLSILQAIDHFRFLPLAVLSWYLTPDSPAGAPESAVVAGQSRAPPA